MSIIPEELLKIHWITDYWNGYLNIILQWPIKLACVVTGVALLWKAGKYTKHLSTDTSVIGGWLPGLLAKNNDPLPYLLLVLLMAPVIFMAGAGHDFQEVYPKLQMIDTRSRTLGSSLLFELCYGMDFFTIELFFRGFLVLACMRYGGRQAILPMAVFYCTIHFGKPLAECISSFFGGLVLGAVVYNTRSIWGGLILHLGLAWTMEVAGWTYS